MSCQVLIITFHHVPFLSCVIWAFLFTTVLELSLSCKHKPKLQIGYALSWPVKQRGKKTPDLDSVHQDVHRYIHLIRWSNEKMNEAQDNCRFAQWERWKKFKDWWWSWPALRSSWYCAFRASELHLLDQSGWFSEWIFMPTVQFYSKVTRLLLSIWTV